MTEHTHTVSVITTAAAAHRLGSQQALALGAVLSAFAALAAAIFQGVNAGRQIRATVVSANRQKWVDAIRLETALVLSKVESFRRHATSILPSSAGTFTDVETRRFDLESEARQALYRVRTLLNPGNEDHMRLYGALQSVVSRGMTDGASEEAVAVALQQIVAAEMQKMKRGR